MIDTAYVNLTILCNYTCKHCYTGIAGPKRRNEMTIEEFTKAFKKMAEYGIKNIIFLGGEPQLRVDFLDILDAAVYFFNNVTVETNGSIMNPVLIEHVRYLRKQGYDNLQFFTSIEGATDEENELIRDKGALEAAKVMIRHFKNNNIPISIRATLYNKKIDYKKVIDLAKELGVTVTFVRFLPVGRGKALGVAPDRKLIAEAYEYIKNQPHAAMYDCPYYVYETKFLTRFKDRFEKEGGICSLRAKRRIFVAETKLVYACQFLESEEFKLGNILEDDWKTIESNYDKLLKKLNKIKPLKECNECKYYSVCKGGCAVYPLLIKEGSDSACPIPLLE